MKAILKNALASRKRSIVIWCLAPSIYMVLVTAVYRSFLTTNASAINQAFGHLPDSFKSFIQIQGDFTSPIGFLSSEPYYVILPLVLIALGIALGSSLLAKEENSRTLELLLARPISRGKILLAKGLAGIIILALAATVIGIVVSICVRVFGLDGIALGSIWKAQLMLFLLALIFGSFSFCLTAVSQTTRRLAVGLSALLAIGGYVLTSLEGAVSWLAWPAKVLPYHYYVPRSLLEGSLSWASLIAFIVVTLVLATLTWVGFRRRDIF